MKKITLLSAVVLSAGLVACGGGDPKSASSKPDTLFPDGYTPPSSASSSSTSSTDSGIVKQVIPFHENFDSATNTRTFFTAGYKPLNTNTAQPFYFPAGGFLDEFGNPSPTATSWITADANRKLRIGNGRLTFGQTKLEVNTTTADATVPTWGEFDLSKAYKVSFCVVQVSPASASNFELYVDNNTTGGNNSIYGAGNASRILQVATHTLVPGTRQEVLVPKTAGERLIGSSTSFFQFRVSSGGWAVIDDVVVEYADQPHGFNLPACAAENSIAPPPEAVVPPDAPLAPTFELGNNQLKVNWAAAPRATTYTVAYNTVDSLEGAIIVGDDNADGVGEITDTSTLITGLTNGTSYYVFVKAHNTGGASAFGPSAVAVPEAPAVAPEAPTGLKVFGDSKRALVTWTKTDGAESYSLAVNTMNETTTAVVTDGITNTYQRLTGLVDNTAYYVFLKAKNAVGESIYTSSEVVTPAPSPFIYQANFAVTKDLFFGTNGPAVQTLGVGSEIPMHFIAGGSAGITLEEGGIRLASGGRFTIGQAVEPNAEGVLAQTNTTASDTVVKGVLDLSGYYKIVINVVSAPDNAGLFQVYLDNNTTSGGASIHQTTANSRLINRTASTITDGEEIVFEMNTNRRGTASSFIQLRVDGALGAEGILISGVRIEAIDAPVDGGSSSSEASSSAPVSSAAPSSSVAPSSEASSSSAPASSSEASSSVVPSSSSEASSSVAPSSSSEASSSSTSSAPSGGTDVSFNWASFDPATYIAILTNPVVSTANNAVLQSATPHSSNGLFFFHSATGTLRHRGGANLEWNFNGTAWASGDPVAIVGAAAEPMRAYIGVPVDAGRDVTLTVVHRNSTTAGNPLGSIVFVGSDGNVLAKYDAKVGTATTTTFNLPAGHTQTEVKILFSREGGGAGGMHLTSISKTYN